MVTKFYKTALDTSCINRFSTDEEAEGFFAEHTAAAKYGFKVAVEAFMHRLMETDDYEGTYRDGIIELAEMCEYPGLEMERFGISCDYTVNPELLSVDMSRMIGKEEIRETFERIFPSHIIAAEAKVPGSKFILPYFVKMGKVNMGYAECTLEDADILIEKCNYVYKNRKNRYRIKECLPMGDKNGKPDYRTELYGKDYLKDVEMFHMAITKVRKAMHVGGTYLNCFVRFS